MFCDCDSITHYDYAEFRIDIFPHKTDDGCSSHYDVYCFAIGDYDENNIPDNCLFNSEDNSMFYDTVDEAMINAESYIEEHF